MESTVKQSALSRFLGALGFGLRLALLTVKYSLVKRTNQKLATYQDDVFFYWIWRWTWEWNFAQQKWTACQLKAYCPVCQSKLTTVKTSNSTVLICPKGGGKHGELFTYETDIAKSIKPLILERAARRFNLNER